ncbi:hypothetical protein AVEN_56223-1 [Araneus ventricosus]|uniref:Uncharacterized protein n=1 Tax=Araneus ventricosus TaxID=182803 RepID=A0A4Y2IZT2_ARAVE|nr:hypothetical protein AVEN_56223-1 [Araneus ventricosus]
MIRCGLFCSTFWADLKALRIIRESQTSDMPTTEAKKLHGERKLSDSFLLPKPLSHLKADIKSAALSIWQDNWDNGETGRSTHDIVPRVSSKPVGWNREEIMFVTGHGPFPSYLLRFNLRTHDNCFEHMTKRRSNSLCHKMSVYPLLAFPNSNSVTQITVVEKHSHEQLIKNPTSTPNAFHM